MHIGLPYMKVGYFICTHSEHVAMLTTNTSHAYNIMEGGGERTICCHDLF